MTQPITLDVHAHLVPVDLHRLTGIEGVEYEAKKEVMVIDGNNLGLKALFRPEALISWMNKNAVARAFISAPPPLYREYLRSEKSRSWTDYINDGLISIAARFPDMLDALVHLPTSDPEVASNVASSAIERGHRKFAMPTGTGDGRVLSDECFDTLWQTLDAGRAFVFFHPGECADGRLKSHYLTNLVGNPYESTVAISHLLFGGVLERFTDMTVCFAHGGGMMPMVAGRLQRGFDTERPGIELGGARPLESLQRIYVDCICHGKIGTNGALAVFGRDKVLFGSDWPFPMGILEPDGQLADLPSDVVDDIIQNNPHHLLKKLD